MTQLNTLSFDQGAPFDTGPALFDTGPALFDTAAEFFSYLASSV